MAYQIRIVAHRLRPTTSVSIVVCGCRSECNYCSSTVHVFDSNTHNTHLYDANEILLLLFQLYFEAIQCRLNYLYSIRIRPNMKSYNSHLAQYLKVVIQYSNMFHDNKPVFPAIHNWPCKVQLSLTMYHVPCMLVYQKQITQLQTCATYRTAYCWPNYKSLVLSSPANS